MRKKRLSGLDKYVIFSIVILLLYTIFEFVFTCLTGISHDTLTTCFYAAFGGEIFACAMLKKWKLKKD